MIITLSHSGRMCILLEVKLYNNSISYCCSVSNVCLKVECNRAEQHNERKQQKKQHKTRGNKKTRKKLYVLNKKMHKFIKVIPPKRKKEPCGLGVSLPNCKTSLMLPPRVAATIAGQVNICDSSHFYIPQSFFPSPT